MKRLITLSQAPLRHSEGGNTKILDIPKGEIVKFIELVPSVDYGGVNTIWAKIEYHERIGYSYMGFFDEYKTEFVEDIVDIDIATASPYDPKQYITYDGRTKYNMCGELCVCYCLGVSISELLDVWDRKSPSLTARIFKGSRDVGTSVDSLINMFAAFGETNTVKFNVYFRDPVLERTVFSPARAQSAIESGKQIIMGVKINKYTGKLATSGILHWISLNEVYPEADGGMVVIYNPFNNGYEQYCWSELIASSGNIDGVVFDDGLGLSPSVEKKDVIATISETATANAPLPSVFASVDWGDFVEEDVGDVPLTLNIDDKVTILWEEWLTRKIEK